MKYGDIVKFKDTLGKLVNGNNDDFLFHPMGFGNYYKDQLKTVTEIDIVEANFKDKIYYIEHEFNWGKINKTHCIGDYQIIEYIKNNNVSYHPYINFKDTNTSYDTLDNALIGVIARNKLEVNEAMWAYSFIKKMLKSE